MGLKKRRQLPNGVSVNYHRITRIEHIPSMETWVTVASYTSQAKRRELIENEGADVYCSEVPYLHDYDSKLDIAKAYAWLKTLDEFENAEDALEED